MKTISVSRIIALCVMLAHSAHAQTELRQAKGERPSFQAMWEKYDADGDGFLTFEEFQSMPRVARLPDEKQRQLFQRLDKNADGRVTQAELRQMRHSRDGQRPAHGMRRLMELDTNGSGGVCLEEFRAGEMVANLPAERIEALFRRLDTDGDGEITPKDRPELSPNFRPSHGPRGERSQHQRRGRSERDHQNQQE